MHHTTSHRVVPIFDHRPHNLLPNLLLNFVAILSSHFRRYLKMPRKCSAGYCKGNYSSTNTKVRVYGFPTDTEECNRWLAALPNKIEKVTKNMGICQAHWPPDTPMTDNIRFPRPKKPHQSSIVHLQFIELSIWIDKSRKDMYRLQQEPTAFLMNLMSSSKLIEYIRG